MAAAPRALVARSCRVAGLLTLAACAAQQAAPSLPDPPPPPPKVVHVPAPAPQAGPDGGGAVISGGAAAPIQLRFTSVSQLHQGFFLREQGLRRLGRDLAPCTDHAVAVDVVWSQQDLEGRLVAEVPRQSSRCEPLPIDGGLDLEPLTAVARAMATYRDDVAGRSDFRIANFKIAVDVVSRATVCRFSAAGQHPPDGSSFDRCVRVGGDVVCADPVADGGATRLVSSDPAVVASLRRCLRGP
jgi:hypothetical protein